LPIDEELEIKMSFMS